MAKYVIRAPFLSGCESRPATVAPAMEAGRLPDAQLIFPKVEMRLDAAPKSDFIDIQFMDPHPV